MRTAYPGPDPRTWILRDERPPVSVAFVGEGVATSADALPGRLRSAPPSVAWLHQVHSDRVLEGHPGVVGEGDGLMTARTGLMLAVATADCVPVLLAGAGRIGAAHAGWRGLVAGVLPRTVEALGREAGSIVAWIGPSIGPCCYEVGEDVADRLCATATDDVTTRGRTGRPHVDLAAVARHQLARHGVESVHSIDRCTRCHPDSLASYRRDGAAAGRNWSVIWRSEPGG